ncbi:MAG TPA: hypothetical protein VJ697_14240 [Nitrososphaeraceae archaeon]|nr:hypothetical protein [Nitrososphaeraceae archaeon]
MSSKYYVNFEFIIYGDLIKRTAVEVGLYYDYVSVVDNKLGMDIAIRQITQVLVNTNLVNEQLIIFIIKV